MRVRTTTRRGAHVWRLARRVDACGQGFELEFVAFDEQAFVVLQFGADKVEARVVAARVVASAPRLVARALAVEVAAPSRWVQAAAEEAEPARVV